MRVLVVTSGSTGDVAPYTGLGVRLREAGHEVTVATHAPFAAAFAAVGLPFLPIPGDLREILPQARGQDGRSSGTGPRALAQLLRIARPLVAELGEGIVSAVDRARPDAILLSTLVAPLGYQVAEAAGVPWAGVFLQPIAPTGAFGSVLLGGRSIGRHGNRAVEQVVRLGLVKAIDRYDPARGSFTAYAVITISGEIKRHFRDKTWGVHVPRRIQDLCLEVGHASTVLTSELSRTPTVPELAAYLKVGEFAVREALESSAGYSPASLNAPAGGEGAAEFGDLLGGADTELESVDDKLTVAELLLRLPARERRMLAMRFYGNRTQAEIAAELGISQMHVSRLLSRALTWLREAMLSDAPPRWEGATPQAEHTMRVSVHRADGALTVQVKGEVDRDTAERLRMSLRHAVGKAAPDGLVVDLSGVPLVDAAGVAVLLDAASAASVAGITLRVRGAQAYVARILGVSGLAPLLEN